MWLVLSLVYACQEYNITEKSDDLEPPQNQPEGETELPNGEPSTEPDDTNDTGEAPSDTATAPPVDTAIEEDTDISFDDTADAEYCTPFNDFDGWNFIGDGNWRVENGILVENRSGFYATVAYLHDFSNHQRFSIEVSTAFNGTLNDFAGIVFNLDAANNRYWVARWEDPQGDYNRYAPTGRMEVSMCYGQNCNVLASDDQFDLTFPSDGTFATWQLNVDGEAVEILWEGQVVFSRNVSGISGPGLVGLYSNDNDGGIFYDNFCVWTD